MLTLRTCSVFWLTVLLAAAREPQQVMVRTQDSGSATRLEASVSTSKNTKFVSCWNKGQTATTSRLVKSPVLTSADGAHRAYVEVEATAFQPKNATTYAGPLCQNTSRLFLAGASGASFKLVYTQSIEFSDGNSLKLVDWSPDGMHVLMERTSWPYESEGDFTDALEFNLMTSDVTTPDLSKILEAKFGKDCGSENSIVGFTQDGDVIVSVKPLADTYYNEGATSCVKMKTLLTLDAKQGLQSISRTLPRTYQVIRNGKFPPTQQTQE